MGDETRPRHLERCPCGNGAFPVTTEKLYTAAVDSEGVPGCREQSEFVKSIACSKCGREFAQEDFRVVDF